VPRRVGSARRGYYSAAVADDRNIPGAKEYISKVDRDKFVNWASSMGEITTPKLRTSCSLRPCLGLTGWNRQFLCARAYRSRSGRDVPHDCQRMWHLPKATKTGGCRMHPLAVKRPPRILLNVGRDKAPLSGIASERVSSISCFKTSLIFSTCSANLYENLFKRNLAALK
jgi:hypothetical protein